LPSLILDNHSPAFLWRTYQMQ